MEEKILYYIKRKEIKYYKVYVKTEYMIHNNVA